MRIALDPQTFAIQEYGGISRYFCNLAVFLSARQEVEVKIFAPLHVNAYLASLPTKLVNGWKIQKIQNTTRLRHIASLILAYPSVKQFRPDILHETYFSPFAYKPKKAHRVLTVYDMIHERFPYMFSKFDPIREWKKKAINRADQVICISENTRQDLLEFYDLPSMTTSVVYLGYDQFPPIAQINFRCESLFNSKPYLLYVGNRSGHKNFMSFIRAYASSSWLRDNFRVLCFGGGLFHGEELDLFNQLRLSQDQIVQFGGGDDKLNACYRHAEAFIYPSLYEGFGIPLLEAMSQSCPVICSNTSSLPEVAGDAAEYFNPNSIESIREAIDHVLNSKEQRDNLVNKGKLRCKQFTWERCADQTLTVYRSLV